MSKRIPFFLFIAIFAVSIGFSFYADINPHADAKAYNHIAWNLVRGLGYLEDEDLLTEHQNITEAHLKDDAIIRVGPGYEFFLASIYSLKGFDPAQNYASPDMWRVVWIAHALLRALTALLIFKIALLLFADHQKKEWIGFVAAAIFGFFPDLILINGFLLYETLLLFLGVAAVYYSLKSLSPPNIQCSPKTLNVGLAGLFWALAILTRPSELLPFLVFPAVLIWQKHWRGAIISFLFPVLLVGGWSLRNSLLYDQPLFTTTAGAYALWVGNNEHATGGYDRPMDLREARSAHHSTTLSTLSLQKVRMFIKDHPFKFLELQIRKTAMYFSLIRPTGFWPEFENTPGKRLLIVISSALMTAFLFLTGVFGIWRAWDKRSTLFIALIGFAFTKPLTAIPLYVETRYRYGFYPLLALFAAFVIITFFTTKKRHALLKPVMIVSGFFLLFTAIDMIYAWEIIAARLPALLSLVL